MRNRFAQCVTAAALACCTLPLYAQSQPPAGERRGPPPEGGPGGQGRPHREPPPFAFDGCKGKKEGDAVMLSPPNHEKVAATCMKWDDGRLFARPQRPQGPPPADKRPADDKKSR